jgi:hypothetical protein
MQFTVEVQNNSQAEIQKAQTILSYRNPKWTTQSIHTCKPCKSIDIIWQRSLNQVPLPYMDALQN